MFKWTVAVIFTILFCLWATLRIYNYVVFGIHCGGHLKRAADANTVELATQELQTALQYMEDNGLTSGYTSILYRTPDEDVGFWHQNIKSSLQELMAVRPDATQLEKTNLLMKLRETLLDEGSEGVKVTVPDGISIFPHNVTYCLFFWITFILAVIGWVAVIRVFIKEGI